MSFAMLFEQIEMTPRFALVRLYGDGPWVLIVAWLCFHFKFGD
jgi:hypothetical protein